MYLSNDFGEFLMKKLFYIFVFFTFTSLISAQTETPRFPVENSNGEWFIENAERTGDVRFADFLGQRALWLKNNTQVMRAGLEFTDGIIEFDVAPMDRSNFFAVIFRREGFQNHENIYFRIHRSGLYNALQYAPRINGSSTWQLYPEFNTAVDLPRNQWTHVKIEVQGEKLDIYLNNAPKPALSVSRLRHQSAKGTVGFWARVNDQPTIWSAAISNISIRPGASPKSISTVRGDLPKGTISNWEVGGAVQTEKGSVTKLPPINNWKKAETEESGLINLNRSFGFLRGRWTAFARTNIKSAEAKKALLELGYSDDVTIFLNGEAVYSGINGFESRHPEYMGFVKPEFENVFLNLRSGDNELILAVTDDQRFGWGFAARLKE